MDGFQKSVLIAGIIILIISLVFIGIILNKSKSDQVWPPILGECPDYWVDLKKDGSACYNAQKLGTCNIPSESNKNTMNFSTDLFTGTDGACNKKKWASKCSVAPAEKGDYKGPVTWDGITYGVTDPCENEDEPSTSTTSTTDE